MNNKQTNPKRLFRNKRSAKEQEIHERHVKARRSYDEDMDLHEEFIHKLNRENGIGVKDNVQN